MTGGSGSAEPCQSFIWQRHLTLRAGPRLAAIDRRGVLLIRTLPHPRTIVAAFAALSRLTDHSAAWMAAGVAGVAFDRGRRRAWLGACLRIVAVEAAARAVKRTLPRRRPELAGLPPLAPTTSPNRFPSSHTAAAVAAVEAFDGLLPRRLLRLIVVASAFSRPYLGVHYPSDVLAGYVVGRALSARGLSRRR